MRSEHGFTLIETLVALSILAVLALTVSGGVRFGLRVWETAERRADRLEEVTTVQTLLRRQIEQAYPLLGRTAQASIVFEGDRERLRFLTVLPMRMGVAGLADVALRYEAAGRSGGRMVMAWQALGERERAPAERTLLDGVERLEFAYYGGDTRMMPATWRDSWRDAGFLPDLVRLRVRLRDDRRWPDLVVAPATTLDSLLD